MKEQIPAFVFCLKKFDELWEWCKRFAVYQSVVIVDAFGLVDAVVSIVFDFENNDVLA